MLEKTHMISTLTAQARVYPTSKVPDFGRVQHIPQHSRVEKETVVQPASTLAYRQAVPATNCEVSRQWDSESQTIAADSLHPKQQAALAALLFRKGLLAQLVHSASLGEG